MATFEQQVRKWINKADGRFEAVAKTAAQDLASEANTPQDQGGLMPVDTGYLRNSIAADLNRIPSSKGNPGEVGLVINRWATERDTLYIGWGSEYAPYMEAMYGFREAAAQRWPQLVETAVRRAMTEIR